MNMFFAFKDINPSKPVHILLVPKSSKISFNDFMDLENDVSICHFFRVARMLIKQLGIEGSNQLIMNSGDKFQEVPHFHLHITGNPSI